MKSSFKVAVLLLALALILAAGCVQPEDDIGVPVPGEENGNEEIGDDNGDSEVKENSGTYLGQIDSHSIEIQISGVPEEIDPRAFQLSSRVQEEFESYGFETGDQVKFSYTVQDHGQVSTMTIIEIEKIQN